MSTGAEYIRELQTERVKLKDEIKQKMEESRMAPASDLVKIALQLRQLRARENLLESYGDILDSVSRQAAEAQQFIQKRKEMVEILGRHVILVKKMANDVDILNKYLKWRLGK